MPNPLLNPTEADERRHLARVRKIVEANDVEGEVVLKRQYKIEDGKLEFMLETDMNIHDDLLQRELSESSDE